MLFVDGRVKSNFLQAWAEIFPVHFFTSKSLNLWKYLLYQNMKPWTQDGQIETLKWMSDIVKSGFLRHCFAVFNLETAFQLVIKISHTKSQLNHLP